MKRVIFNGHIAHSNTYLSFVSSILEPRSKSALRALNSMHTRIQHQNKFNLANVGRVYFHFFSIAQREQREQ